MAIVINGSGTVTGLAVGGLPDGTVDAGTLATDSVVTGKIADGTIANADIAALAASKLTGALPAISGASLTGFTDAQMPAGSVLQVVYDNNGSAGVATTSTTYVTWATAPTAVITPISTSSRIIVFAQIGMQYDATGQIENTIYRTTGGTATELSGGSTYGLAFNGVTSSVGIWQEVSINYIDSPNTTSACTYAWYARSEGGQNVTVQHHGAPTNMILMEIAG